MLYRRNEAFERVNQKYGVTQKTTSNNTSKSNQSTKGNQSKKGKQSNSASLAPKTPSVKTKTQEAFERVNQKYGVSTKQNSTVSKPTQSNTTKKYIDYSTEPEKDYTSAKNKVKSTTTITSKLSEEDRKKRINEINSELTQLSKNRTGLSRASQYGNVGKMIAENEARQAELKKELKELQRVGTFTASEMKQFEIDDAKAKKSALPTFNPTGRMTLAEADTMRESVSKSMALDKEINRLEQEKAAYKKLEQLDRLNAETTKITSKEDFAQNSKYSPNKPKTAEELKAEGYKQDVNGKWYKQNFFGTPDFYTGEDSDLYTYINDINSRQAIGVDKMMQTSYGATAYGGGVPSGGVNTYEQLGYHTLTDEEKGAFNYLYHQDRKNGTNTAEEYLKKISPLLQQRAMELEAKRYSEISKEAPVIMSGMSLGTNFQNALMFPAKAVATATGVYEDIPALDIYGNRTQAIRGVVSEDMGTVGKLAYNATMSIGDMGVAMLAGGGNAKLVQAIMSSSAGSSTISNAKNNGASDGKALVMGLGSAAIEWATERYSVEAILKQPKSILGFLTTNTLTEATEEGAANIGNIALDAIVSDIFGERSEIEQRIDYLVANGIAEDVALQIVFEEKLQSLGEDMIVGGLTGFGMSSAKATPIAIQRGIDRYNKPTQVGSTPKGNAPQQTISSDPIEQAAREDVAERNRTSAPAYERLEAMSRNNEPITVEDVKKVTGFGEEGAKMVAELANQEGETFSKAEAKVKTAYLAGMSNVEGAKANFTTDTQIDAFTAGKKDRVNQELAMKARAKNATVYKGAFHENKYTKNFTDAEKTMISTIAKSLRMDVSVVDKIIANEATGAEANARHVDGKLTISNNRSASKVVSALILHEGGHRMRQLAPTEFGALMDALYERAERLGRATKLGVTQGLRFDDIKAKHDNAGIEMETSGYIEEIAVRELETLFNSPEEFNAWYAEISTNQQAKTGLQKLMNFISELIEDIKRAVAELSGKSYKRAEAENTVKELERIKELYANAFKAAEKAVIERAKAQEKKAQTEINSGTNFSLSDSKSGRANDLLLPYNDELTGYINQRGDYIVNNFEGLKKIVNLAFDNRQKKATAYFGIIPSEIISKIEKNIPNLPRALNGVLFKTGKDYSIATTLDSIRHLADEKSLTREEIIDYLDRMADTIVEFDTVNFDYYYEKGNTLNGLLFKKAFDDGVLTSFEIVSNKKRSLNLQTFYMQKGDYQKKKSADSTLLEINPTADVQDEERSNFNNILPQKPDYVKSNFSLKSTDSLNTKDRNEFLDVIEHLKGEFEITKFPKADSKKLAKMTREVLKEYSSQADFDETYKAIDELYKYMANGEDGHPAVWKDVYDRAYNIAREIVINAVAVDDYSYKEYKSLRDYLRKTPMKFYAGIDSVPSSYENFNEFRKMNMGRLKFTNDGVAIDAVYQELAGLYPEFFDSERENNTADQLERVIDVLDELQPTEVNPFDRQIEQASAYLASDLASRFFDIPQAKPTFADKAERRVTEAHIKGAKKVEAVRQQKDEKIQKLIEAQREKTRKQLDKLREQRDTKVKKEQEKRRAAISKMSESQKAKVYRARIMRHASDLNKKLINPTDNQHIPYELQGAVATLLEHINLESNYTYDTESHSYKKNDEGLPTSRTKAFEELRGVYKNIASSVVVDPDLLGEDGLLSDVIKLADKRIADMTSSEIETVWQTMRAIEASVNTANKLFSQGKFATILEVAEALRADNKGKTAKTELKGILGKGKKLATLDMLTPETYLHYLGKAGDSVFRMMRDAQDKHIKIMKEVADFTHKTLKDVDVNSLETTIHTVKLGGENVQLSTAQLMELYVLMKREQAVDHILVGGILPDDVKTKGIKDITRAEPVRNVTVAEISKATAKLTDKQKAIADKLQRYVSSVLSAYGNEASMQVYNYEKFNEKNYWTIRTNKQEIASDVSKDTAVSTVAGKGMAKGTKPHANTSVRIGSIFDTFSAHSSDMATYAAWLGTTEDVNRIRNFVFWEDGVRTGTVKGILDAVHGKSGAKYFEKLLTDISIGVQGTDNLNPFDKLVGHYKAASIGANLRVIIQQPTAILRALDMIDARYFAESGVHPLKGWEKAKKYAPIAQWKDWGYFDINTGRQMKDILFDNANLLEKTKQVGMWGASKADSISWGQLWNAVEAETKATRKELEVGSELYYETVAKRFTEIIDHTQVVDGILQRSQLMRSPDSLTKMATSFMGEPTKQYNMAVAAFNNFNTSKGKARKSAANRLGRTAVALAVSGIINACAQSIIDAMRDDDKEKKYWERWLKAFAGDGDETKWYDTNLADIANPINYVPFAKDIVSIIRGFDVKRMDTEAIGKVVDASKNMYKSITDTGKYTIAEASAQLFAEIARMFGVPVANVKRDIKSLVMSVAIETDSYLMQYRIEKAMLDINYAGNSKNFMDILFNAYNNDREAYEFIYNDMLKNGYEADKIQNGMETRMKKAEGVEKTSELSKRFMTPSKEKQYDSSLSKIKSSRTWQSASPVQRKKAELNLYDFITSTSKDIQETRAEARALGIDETEYTLWQLAKEMANTDGKDAINTRERAAAVKMLDLPSDTEWDLYLFKNESRGATYAYENGIECDTYADFIEALNRADKPTKSGNYGSFTQDESTQAVKSLDGLSRKEKATLWQSVNSSWKKNPYR